MRGTGWWIRPTCHNMSIIIFRLLRTRQIIMTIEAPFDAPPKPVAASRLLTSPILTTLLRLAVPNTVAMFGTALVAVAETSYIGRLGTVPLAAIALVFPFTMLTQMMSAGAMGGGVSSAISRALGAGDRE